MLLPRLLSLTAHLIHLPYWRPLSTMAAGGVNRAAWQQEAKGPFNVADADLWEPSENEVRIKVREKPSSSSTTAHTNKPPVSSPTMTYPRLI